MNICFEKPKVGVIMLLMDAIDIGYGRTAAGGGEHAQAGAFAQFGAGVCSCEDAAKAFSAEIAEISA